MKRKTVLYRYGTTIEVDAARESEFEALLDAGWVDSPGGTPRQPTQLTQPTPQEQEESCERKKRSPKRKKAESNEHLN